MAEKIKVPRAKILAEDKQFVSYTDEGGTLRKARASNVEVIEEGVNGFVPAAPAQPASDVGGDTREEATDPPPPEASPPSSDTTPPAATDQPKPKRTRKTTMTQPTAAKKKAAPPVKAKVAAKKTAPKTAPKARVEATGVRTIGGKAVNLDNYEKVKAPGGGTSYHNGDPVAEKLAGKSLDEVYGVAAKTLKADEKELRKKYSHLNQGMQRMALGNRMRSILIPKEARG